MHGPSVGHEIMHYLSTAGNQTMKAESGNGYKHHYLFGNCNVGSVTSTAGVIVTDGNLLVCSSNLFKELSCEFSCDR